MPEMTDLVWVDIDPMKDVPWSKVRNIAMAVQKAMIKFGPVTTSFSGNRGFHIRARLAKKMDVDDARKSVIDLMNKVVVPRFDNVTTGLNHTPDGTRLDVTTLHDTGSLRVPGSLNAKTGLVAGLVKNLADVQKGDFTIDKVSAPGSSMRAADMSHDPNDFDSNRWYVVVDYPGGGESHDFGNAAQAEAFYAGLKSDPRYDGSRIEMITPEDIKKAKESDSPGFMDALRRLVGTSASSSAKVGRSATYKRTYRDPAHTDALSSASGWIHGTPLESSVSSQSSDQAYDSVSREPYFVKLMAQARPYLDRWVAEHGGDPESLDTIEAAYRHLHDTGPHAFLEYVKQHGNEMTPELKKMMEQGEADAGYLYPLSTLAQVLKTAKTDPETAIEQLQLLHQRNGALASTFKFDPNSTEHEGRWRLRDPNDFDKQTFRRWKTWAGVQAPHGVTFIIGTLKKENGGTKAIQTIRFKKSVWSEKQAAAYWQSLKNEPGFEKLWTQQDWRKWMKKAQLGNPLADDKCVTVYLVRHGSTKLNEEDKLRGWLNIPLSDEGMKQAEKIGTYFAKIKLSAIYCSDLQRAQSTAAPIAKATGIKPEPTAMLRPINFGDLQGRPVKEIEPELAAIQKKWESDPNAKVAGGESFHDFQERNIKVLEAAINKAEPGSSIAIVVHLRNCIWTLGYVENGGPLEGEDLGILGRVTQDVAGISVLKFDKTDGDMQVSKANYTEHLNDHLENGGCLKEGANGRSSSWLYQASDTWISASASDKPSLAPENSTILVGTSGFKYKHWSETFYPRALPGREWLHYYSQKFPTVEISSTFHHMPEPRVLKNWHDRTPDDFVLAIRGPKRITHDQHLLGCNEVMSPFMRRLEMLGDKLGPITFQLMQSELYDKHALSALLDGLPTGFRYSIEFRSEPWYNDEALDMLAKHNVATVVVGHSNMGIHTRATADWSHVRMSGHHPDFAQNCYSREQLMNWRGIIADAAKPAFVYFNNEYKALAATNALQMIEIMALRRPKPSKPMGTPKPRNISPDVEMPSPSDDWTGMPNRPNDDSKARENGPAATRVGPEYMTEQYPMQDW